jgi:hypothetical protein
VLYKGRPFLSGASIHDFCGVNFGSYRGVYDEDHAGWGAYSPYCARAPKKCCVLIAVFCLLSTLSPYNSTFVDYVRLKSAVRDLPAAFSVFFAQQNNPTHAQYWAFRYKDKLMAVYYDTIDSVTIYGKTINNPRRVVRVGQHVPANCEDLRGEGAPANVTRPNVLRDTGGLRKMVGREDGGLTLPWPPNNTEFPKGQFLFRPRVWDWGILHLGDSFVKRGNRLKNGSWPRFKTAKGIIDFYSRDWAAATKADLERRSREKPDLPPVA